MCPLKIAGIALATCVIVTPSAFAQTKTEPAAKSSKTTATRTFTGCVMTEPDYRRAHNLGKGALGGVGLGDEYVLVDVTVAPAKSAAATADTSGSAPASTSAASSKDSKESMGKCADQGTAYRLTGKSEEKMKAFVGRQLEIQGRFQHADDAAAANGARPGEKLPAEVEIVSFREAQAPATVSEPAAPPAQAQPAPPRTTTPQTAPSTPPTTEKRELPHSASSTGLLALIGLLALSSGIAFGVLRRRVV